MGGFARPVTLLGGAIAMAVLAACGGQAGQDGPDGAGPATPAATGTSAAGAVAADKPAAARASTAAPAARPAVPAAMPRYGNPAGKARVPAAARAVDTSHPDHVIGTGSPSGCTSAAVVRAVALGGVITFDCGPEPVTIVMTQTAKVVNTAHDVVIDGGGKVTLSGDGRVEILYLDTCDKRQVWTTSDCYDQEWPSLTVQNITFTRGYSGTRQGSSGQPYGGGAIFAEGGQLKAVNSRFIRNGCYRYGPDLGGGAIRALAQWENRPVYITDDTFSGGRCSNGGALSSISVQWDVLNSTFTGNQAVGWGANPAASGTPGGGSGGAIYLDGVKDNVLISGSVFRDDTAREGGGAIFDVVDQYWGALTLRDCTLSANVSGEFQNYPGIFYDLDGKTRPPAVTG